MAFPMETVKTPTDIGTFALTLITRQDEGEPKEGRFSFEVTDQDGKVMAVRNGDVLPHLTSQQAAGALALMEALRALARATLPNP